MQGRSPHARHREHLLLAAGRCPRAGAAAARAGESDVGDGFELLQRRPAVRRHPEVLAHRQVREDPSPFRHEAHAAPARSSSGAAPFTLRPPTKSSPRVTGTCPAITAQQRGLPPPFGPRRPTRLRRAPRGRRRADLDAPVPRSARRAARARARRSDAAHEVTVHAVTARGAITPREVGAHRVGRPDRDDLPEVEHVDAVAHLHHQPHVVLDEQDRESVLAYEPAQQRLEDLRLVVGLTRAGSSSSSTRGWIINAGPPRPGARFRSGSSRPRRRPRR